MTGESGLPQPPSMLILYTDQWRWDALGCLGSPALTPVLDALAADGVHFDHAVAQSPVCMPSRASLLTGRYPSDLGITHMGVPVPPETETIATVLGRRGYSTANIGKLHFQPHANRDHASPHPSYGFDELVLSDEPGVYEDDYRAWVRTQDPAALEGLSPGLPPAARTWQETFGEHDGIHGADQAPRSDFDAVHEFPYPPQLTHTAWVATRTIDHLAALVPGQPALTIASFFSPHAPFNVPASYLDLYDRDRLPLPDLSAAERTGQDAEGPSDEQIRMVRHGYYAAISEVDHHIGRILAHLEDAGRANNTIVVFVSDHGEWLGDHLRFSKGYPADDPVSRVPLIIRWPDGVVSPGRRVTDIVELIDLLPTLLEASAVPVPRTLQGHSLLPALRDEVLNRPAIAVTEHAGWRSVRTPRYRYLIHADGTECLWDLVSDPGGHVDVAADPDHADTLAEHRRLLLQRLLESERPLPRTWPY
ncbi:sulfatase family protein [Tessaracoccus antarcticus]|uniref:DUF229 domain-containing protein n=1 Tax=Tessaracoccus antarcticus TaxID=2479848 RepID=A0A3M0GNW3_9ACTN|nr:sulfatase-like hydrolase/transferase [Tessaracoccus antarcticus]RMB58976.1 DUF229 domain-containing protein [Tessaracoccus antarcticus]